MPATPRKQSAQAYPCEISLQPLRNCLVNLPAALVSVLENSNTVAQNVIVELTIRQAIPTSPSGRLEARPTTSSVYVGWTGMQSKRRLNPIIGRDGLGGRGTSASNRDQEVPIVEIDSTFGSLLGLSEGQKVGVLLRRDPPESHTINIDPLTAADYEIIELHANFLELHLVSQIRALPNPSFTSPTGATGHPLTLHLSPTSTANIRITSLTPPAPATSPYTKLAADAEVIVAPKSRPKTSQSAGKENRSVHSGDGRSAASTGRNKTRRSDSTGRKALFLRGVDRTLCTDWFDNDEDVEKDEGMRIWIDWSVLTSRSLRGVTWAWVSIVKPNGLQEMPDPQQQSNGATGEGQESVKPANRIMAQVCAWEEAPDARHVAVSSSVTAALDATGMVGEVIRLEAAPSQVPRSSLKTLRVYPFTGSGEKQREGFKFGSKSKTEREEAVRRILAMYGRSGNRLLEGPITDGMMLPPVQDIEGESTWRGGILKFDPPPGRAVDGAKSSRGWLLGSEKRPVLEVAAEIPKAAVISTTWSAGEPLPDTAPRLVGIDDTTTKILSHIKHASSLLLTGGLGSGKTSLAQLLALKLRRDNFFHTTFFSCRSLVTEETRVSTIKETLQRIFGIASWGARFGGTSLVILDDLDKLCPVETELQVGGENGRSRHVSEIICSIVNQYCYLGSRVVLLATAQSKDDINSTIVGAHVVREFVGLHAPDKENRRLVLETLVQANRLQAPIEAPADGDNSTKVNGNDTDHRSDNHMNDSSSESEPELSSTRSKASRLSPRPTGFTVDREIDFLDIAGQTDGYMPGDLVLLVSRARSEALIRTVSESQSDEQHIELTSVDFAAALKGFTPSSLRNVTLQHSTTTFASIGGLRETRQTLLETLQYPTLYAPIFARCPLRLRSGLLLYGYPGCGKTLLASAVAGECGLNFISVKGPEILNKYIGASEKSVRDLFERAQAARPCVLFFDEFDSVAPKRGHDSTGVTDRVVNQLLTQMDGAEGLSGVYVLAATSRPDLIDPALLRPGRLDKSLLCDMPDFEDRVDILRALSSKLRMSHDILGTHASLKQKSNTTHRDINEIARRTEGYSGADLQAVVYNAHLEAIHAVLDEHPSASTSRGSRPSSSTGQETDASSPEQSSAKGAPDFTYFPFGENEEDRVPLSAAGRAAERAKIASQLAGHRLALQKARASRHGVDGFVDKSSRGGAGNQEPIIQWVHIEKSLAQTRPSISHEERRRLAGIYREFIVGRNGEMPSGQGGSEIGGRSSLM